MFQRLLKRFKGAERSPARVPDGMRVYTIGDIHGRADLVQNLHRMIQADASTTPSGTTKTAIYLGDYVDRGLHSRDVIDLLLDEPLEDFDKVYLKGNHDDEFLNFLDDESEGPDWFRVGGDATVYSYGVRIPRHVAPGDRFTYIQEALRAAVPPRHLAFLAGLELVREIGDYLFVHAGIRPGKALNKQEPEDMLWIRDEFLESRANHGKVVVHGHSVSDRPEVRVNRIGIDTGAYASNQLTCLVLEGATRRFLSTA